MLRSFLKFSTLSTYDPSLVSNPRDEISNFVTGVANLVVEECRTAMLHDDMTLARLMVYAQSNKESKIRRMARCFKRSGSRDQEQTRSKRRFNLTENLGVISLRLRKEVVPLMENLFGHIVAINIMVSVNWVPGVPLVVVKMGIK